MRFMTSIVSAVVGVSVAASTIAFAADVESLPGSKTENPNIARQCLHDLQTYDAKLARIGFGLAPPRGSGTTTSPSYYTLGAAVTPRQKIRSLRDTAFAYAMDGKEQTCQVVLASMREVFDKHQKVIGVEADDPSARRAWRRAHLSRAEPVAQMNHLVRADILIGSDIRNLKDERLGEIEDLVLNPKERNILYVLVSRGGALGFGEKLVAIRWSDLRATADHELYLLDVPAQVLKDAPEVDRHNFEKTVTPDWQRTLSAYWDGALKP